LGSLLLWLGEVRLSLGSQDCEKANWHTWTDMGSFLSCVATKKAVPNLIQCRASSFSNVCHVKLKKLNLDKDWTSLKTQIGFRGWVEYFTVLQHCSPRDWNTFLYFLTLTIHPPGSGGNKRKNTSLLRNRLLVKGCN
jgi:hypothetical protein